MPRQNAGFVAPLMIKSVEEIDVKGGFKLGIKNSKPIRAFPFILWRKGIRVNFVKEGYWRGGSWRHRLVGSRCGVGR